MPSHFQQTLEKSQFGSILDSLAMSGITASGSLQDVRQLLTYRAFLQTMRQRKASANAASFPLEAAVLTQARATRDATRRLVGEALTNIQRWRQSALASELIKTVEQSGELDLAVELGALNADSGIQESLQKIGVPAGLLKDAATAIQTLGLKVGVRNGELSVTSANARNGILFLGSDLGLQLGAQGPLARHDQLLRQPLFDTVVSGFAQRALPGAVTFNAELPRSQTAIRLELYDSYAVAGLGAVSELERHVRKLECTGSLDTHIGASQFIAGIIVGVIGIILIIVGTIIGEVCGTDAGWCTAGDILRAWD